MSAIQPRSRVTPSFGWLAVLLSGGLAGIGFSWAVAQHSLIGARWHLILLVGAWVPVGLLSAWAARRLPTRVALAAVLLLAVALRLAAATGTTPSISNDVYRYAWDAHIQLSGTDPYRYPPDARQLESLRTPGFWPSPAECRHIGDRPGCTILNRPGVRTIYPAVAEGWFVLVHLVTPGDAGSRPWQIAGGLVDDATIVLIALHLRDQRRDPRQVAWYAFSPLPVIEFAGNGHVDGLALLLLVAALLALRRDRGVLAGMLIGLATMVKLYPALAVVAGWRQGRWRLLLGAAVIVVGSELPHVVVIGGKILGYLPGYLQEEHYTSGSRFLLLGLLYLPGKLTVVLAAGCLLAATFLVFRSRLPPATGLALLLAVLMFVTTPVQPWYTLVLAGVAILVDAPWFLAVPLAGEVYYAAVILDDPHQIAVGRLSYLAAAAVVGIACWWSGRRTQPTLPLSSEPRPIWRTQVRR